MMDPTEHASDVFGGGGTLAVLGGAGGIGRDLVACAPALGFRPVVLDLPTSLAAHPSDCPAVAVDATSEASLVAAAQALPDDLAGLVCLAGFMRDNSALTDVATDVWDEVIEGNLRATYLAAKHLSSNLRKGGAMVLTGSGLGHFARPGYGPYAISKAGIAAMTRQLALEMAPDIRVNCVAPSAVDTAFLRGGTGRSEENQPPAIDLEAYAKAIPMGRIATVRDVTGPILFLLSNAAAYMTGQVLHINGGAFMPS